MKLTDSDSLLQENKILGTSFSFYFENEFEKTLSQNNFADLKTGFSNLDAVQEFEPALITIAAAPSVGKTSFIWQLMEQMARQNSNVHCVFL